MTDLKTKYSDLAERSEEDLQKQLVQYKKELFNIRFQRTIEGFADTSRFKKLRINIARIKTILTNKKKAGKKSA